MDFETSRLFKTTLGIWNTFYRDGNNGCCELLRKNPDSRIVALRADLNALPIKEANEVDYKSKNEGIILPVGLM